MSFMATTFILSSWITYTIYITDCSKTSHFKP